VLFQLGCSARFWTSAIKMSLGPWTLGGWQMRLPNYVSGRWCTGLGSGELLVDPVTGDELVSISSEGLDLEAALQFARAHGGPALRQLTYTQRADLLERRSAVSASKLETCLEINAL